MIRAPMTAGVLRGALLAGAAALALAACPDPAEPPDTPTPPQTPPETPTPTPPDDEALEPGPPADHVEPTTSEEELILTDKRVGEHEGFERVVLEFGEEFDGPAADLPPASEVEVVEGSGAVRVHLDGVPAGAAGLTVTDRDGTVTHVFHATDAERYGEASWVDIYTDAPVETLDFRMADPARVVVDLVPAEGEWGAPVDVDALGVLLAPDPQVAHRDSLEVRGYASPFEAWLNLVVTDEAGEVVVEEGTMTAAWVEARGAFAETIDVADWEVGTYTLRVEQSPGHEDDDPLLFEVELDID